MQDTYIKLDRSLLRHRYFDNVNVLKVWLWCLMKASHAPHKHLVKLQTVSLQPGQFVTGRDAASRDLKLPGSTAWTILKLFERDGKININSNNKFSVITVVDFHTYQTQKYQPRQQNQQQADSNQTANGQQPDTNKNGNKGNNDKKETLITFSPSDDGAGTGGEAFYLTKKKRKLTGKRLETFNTFWEAFDYKAGKAEAADAWYEIPSLTNPIVKQIVESARREAAGREQQRLSGKVPKMAQGWIAGRRWEDETGAAPSPSGSEPVTTEQDRLNLAAARRRIEEQL